MWPYETSINTREIIGLILVAAGLILVPVAWITSRQLWVIAGLLEMIGLMVFFTDRMIKRLEKSGQESGGRNSYGMPMPADIHNYTGWRSGGRSETMDTHSSSDGDGD